ncbi:Amine oxidase family protein [Balamuthia mandrillaris]
MAEQEMGLKGAGHQAPRSDNKEKKGLKQRSKEVVVPSCLGACPPTGRCAQGWLKKYFFYGQVKEQVVEVTEEDALHRKRKQEERRRQRETGRPPQKHWYQRNCLYQRFLWKRSLWVATFLPLTVVWSLWLVLVGALDLWYVFGEENAGSKPGWNLTLTMLFGSMVAGGTAEGGGAVAFPVMTLILGLSTTTARDFSLMIQSVGMTSASFAILYMDLLVENYAIVYGSIGGMCGLQVGLEFLAPRLPPAYSKMIFVSVFFAFACSLFALNRVRHRKTYLTIPYRCWWKALLLMVVGFVGGLLTSVAGSGIDICTFSVLTLFFRVSEKTATPTSVLLMAINTVLGFYYRGAVQQDIAEETWHFWVSAVPAVCVGGPLGAFISSYLHRQVLAWFVYLTDTAQFILALAIVEQTAKLQAVTWACLLGGLLLFALMALLGQLLMKANSRKSRKWANHHRRTHQLSQQQPQQQQEEEREDSLASSKTSVLMKERKAIMAADIVSGSDSATEEEPFSDTESNSFPKRYAAMEEEENDSVEEESYV